MPRPKPSALTGTAELGRVFADLLREQAEHNIEALKALTRTVDWN